MRGARSYASRSVVELPTQACLKCRHELDVLAARRMLEDNGVFMDTRHVRSMPLLTRSSFLQAYKHVAAEVLHIRANTHKGPALANQSARFCVTERNFCHFPGLAARAQPFGLENPYHSPICRHASS